MVGRTLLLIAALVVAALGALLVFLYADRADDRAVDQLAPRSVLVVAQPVGAGTTVADALAVGAFVAERVPGTAIPGEALETTEGLEDAFVLVDLYPGEVLLRQRLGAVNDQAGSLEVSAGNLAASFLFGDPNRVATFLTPGDEVAVFLTRTPLPSAEDPTQPDTGTAPRTRVLLPQVRVLAVGGTTTTPQTETGTDGQQQTTEVNQALLTLDLTQDQLERLVLAQTVGELYLGLRSEDAAIEADDGVSSDELFEGSTS